MLRDRSRLRKLNPLARASFIWSEALRASFIWSEALPGSMAPIQSEVAQAHLQVWSIPSAKEEVKVMRNRVSGSGKPRCWDKEGFKHVGQDKTRKGGGIQDLMFGACTLPSADT